MPILDMPLILETRRNHALEHATLHILAEKFPRKPLAGHSNPTGFLVFGDVPTEEVRAAVVVALTRLRAGERHLAIHGGCGTNYAISILAAGLLAWLGLTGANSRRSRLWRLPLVIPLAVLGFFISQPLGPVLQRRVTTQANPGGMQIEDVYPINCGRFKIHRVITQV